MFFAVLTFSAVLVCNVFSKFSFLSIIANLNESLRLHESLSTQNIQDPEVMKEYSVSFVMLAMVIIIPQLLTFLLCLWQSCYAAEGNNPWPSLRSWVFNIIQATLEVFGLCTFVFHVASQLEAAMVLAIMPGMLCSSISMLTC